MTAPPDAHAAEHDDLLHAHLAGDVPADDPLLLERLGQCSACRARLEELRSLTVLLERLGSEQRRSLARPPTPVPGSAHVAATLEALAEGRSPTRLRPVPAPTRRSTLWRVGLAAASVLAAGWVVKALLPQGQAPRGDVLLGSGEDHPARPSGTVEAFAPFRWTAAPGDASYFVVRFWADRQSVTDAPTLEVRLDRFPWTPEPDQLNDLPSAIQWEAIAYDRQGGFLDSSGVVRARIESAESD